MEELNTMNRLIWRKKEDNSREDSTGRFLIKMGRGRYYLFDKNNKIGSGPLNKLLCKAEELLSIIEAIEDRIKCCICENELVMDEKGLLPKDCIYLDKSIVFCSSCSK